MISAIILDWGGVLCEDPTKGFVAYGSKFLGVSEPDLLVAVRRHLDAYTRGLPEAPFWQRVCADLGVQPPAADHSLWGEAFRAVHKPNHGVIALSKALKQQGVRIGFLSNTEKPSREFHLTLGYDFIEARVFSCDEGLAKPEKAIYDLMVARLGVPANQCLMIDDRIENVEGARAAGLQAHHFVVVEDLLAELLPQFPSLATLQLPTLAPGALA